MRRLDEHFFPSNFRFSALWIHICAILYMFGSKNRAAKKTSDWIECEALENMAYFWALHCMKFLCLWQIEWKNLSRQRRQKKNPPATQSLFFMSSWNSKTENKLKSTSFRALNKTATIFKNNWIFIYFISRKTMNALVILCRCILNSEWLFALG